MVLFATDIITVFERVHPAPGVHICAIGCTDLKAVHLFLFSRKIVGFSC